MKTNATSGTTSTGARLAMSALWSLALVGAATACGATRPPVQLPPSTSANVSLGEPHYRRACAARSRDAAEVGPVISSSRTCAPMINSSAVATDAKLLTNGAER